jgi:hypothetical protein
VTAHLDDEPWCKAAAVSPAVKTCAADVVVMADSDVWTDGLTEAVRAVEDGAPWSMPHTKVLRLDEAGTDAVLAGGDWADQPLTQRPYKGIEGGGVVVASREVIHSIPLDSRFTGWG